MSEPTAHGSHGGCAHHHHHLPFGGGLLSRQREGLQLRLVARAGGVVLEVLAQIAPLAGGLDGDPPLEAGERGTQAVVDAMAERQVMPRVGAV